MANFAFMLKSIGFVFSGKILVAIANFILVILLSQSLGAVGKGQCSLYLLIFSTSLILCESISGSTVVFLLQKFSHRQLLQIFFLWSIPCCFLVAIIFYFFGKINTLEVWLVFILCWLNAATTIQQLIVLGKKKLRQYNMLIIGQALLGFLLVFFVFKIKNATTLNYLWAVAIAWSIIFFIGLFFVCKLTNDNPKQPMKLLLVAGFRHGAANQLGTLMQLVNTRIGYMLLPLDTLGVFSNAMSICEATLLLNASIGTIQYTRIAAEENRAKQIQITHECFWANFYLMLCILLVLFLLPAGLYSWLFGADFYFVKEPIRILIPGIFFFSGYIIITYFFSGTGRFNVNIFPILAAMLVTLLGLGTAKFLGISNSMEMIAFVQIISFLVLLIMSLILFFQQENISIKDWMKMPSFWNRKGAR